MRRDVVVLVAAIALAALMPVCIAYAMCGTCGSGNSTAEAATISEAKVINETCPITGEKISQDPAARTDYNGQTIGFCCPDCIGKFKADPAKYMAKIEKEEAAAGAKSEAAGEHPHSH